MTEEEVVTYEVADHIARITLNRPEYRNAQNSAMTYALDAAFQRATDDDEVKVIVLAGNGKHFCAGHDIGTPGRDVDQTFERKAVIWWDHTDKEGGDLRFARESEVYMGMCRRWREVPKPVIAMVHGACIAGGLMLAWSADFIVASDDAFFSDPVVRMGIPGVEYFAHPWVMNPRAAKEFLYSGDRFTADRALALGMVNQVVPRDDLESTVLALAGRIAEMPRFGLALTKKAVNQAEDLQGMRAGMDSVFGLHHFAHAHNAETSDDSLGGLDAKSMAEEEQGAGARVNLDFTPDELAFRDEARAWLAANVPAETLPSMDTEDGFAAHQEWERRLADERWSVVSWPEEFGGRGASLVEWVIFEEEYYRAGAPGRVSQNGIFLLAPIIFDHGTDDQQQRWLPSMATGETIWAQAWSEPEAGSDLASLRSTAKKVDGGWQLNGQKTWSSRATYGHMGFGLFRSDPEAERHRGLTYFCFPLDADGVTVRPIAQLDGEAGFAELFFDDVFVPDADVLGEPGDGWRVAMSTAGNERGLSLRSPGRFCTAADRLLDLYADAPDPALSSAVVDAWVRAEAYRLFTWGTVTRLADGGDIGAAGSVNKVWWSELDVALHETALDLLGPEAEVASAWTDGYLFSLSGPIYAGTNEIQRNIVAERILGLPKERRSEARG